MPSRPNPQVAADEESDARSAPGAAALRRGLALLDIVARSPRPLRFGEIAERAGLPKATVHRMLAVLVEAGLLRQDEPGTPAGVETYRLGLRLFEMAHRVWTEFDLREAALPELARLCESSNETVRLAVLAESEVLYVDQREAQQAVRLANAVGGRVAAFASGAGKAILAHLDPPARARLLDQLELRAFTKHTITDRVALNRELDLVRARGYAVSFEEQQEGVASVAAAVLDHRAQPMGAIAILGPSYRLPPDRLHGLGRDVMEAARRTSGNAGQMFMTITVGPRPDATERPRVAFPSSCFLGEGPTWLAREGRLAWVDILAPALHLGDPATGHFVTHPMPELIGAVVPAASGGFVAAMQGGFRRIDPGTGAVTEIASPEAGQPGNRFNDGKCDRRGRFWAGTLAIDTTPDQGALWRLDPDASVRRMESRVHVSNGLGWSPDDRVFYFTDSGRRTIWAYDFDLEKGTIANRRVFASLGEGEGTPDGLTVDAEGHVWVAVWDGWRLIRYAPDGSVERVVALPVPRPTSVAFGGEGFRTLFVTTARIRLSAQMLSEAPLSGSVLALEPGVAGLPEPVFGG